MYNHKEIEPKWQQYWKENKTFQADDTNNEKPKKYILDMFPYPSGAGLHVGHPEGYTATDILSRYYSMNGYNVLHPMGWDAFGLPAENYAIKTKVHPKETTEKCIANFKKQIQSIGFAYDWDREINTSSKEYYKWTQWMFLFLYKNGLAYKKKAPVNWCDDCKTVLANEQVIDGKCERCKQAVFPKELAQWFFKITDFIEDSEHEGRKTAGLISGLEKIDWPNGTKVSQENWIGKSEGVNVKNLKIKDFEGFSFEVYDSVPQTFMAQTFTVIAPEHPMLPELVKGTPQEQKVLEFIEKIKQKKMSNKFDIETDMEGIFTGRFVEDPYGIGDLPLWVASFVVADYGSGIVNCSAHDERDFNFAKKYDIPLRPVMFPADPAEAEKVKNLEYCYKKDPEGILMEPVEFKGRKWGEVREDIIEYLVEKGIADKAVNYKIRDWLVSRQRYWGAPIPIVYDPDGNPHPVKEEHLPITLPTDVDFNPEGTSPLESSQEYVKRAEELYGKGWRFEVDTMDTFVCSTWYMYRFSDPHNTEEFASKELLNKWLPVDTYVGGAEHTVLHLLYSRFYCKVLHKYGFIEYDEPFAKLRHQGLILGEDNEKMSKSRGNVVNPDDVIEQYGADSLRLYEMFIGDFTHSKPWSMKGIEGVYKFLRRVWKLHNEKPLTNEEPNAETLKIMHKSIQKVESDIKKFGFNTAISQLMIFANFLQKQETLNKQAYKILTLLLSPFAPHLAEEIWQYLGNTESISKENWPKFNPEFAKDDTIELVVQVNGKVREKLEVSADISKEEALNKAKELQKIQSYLEKGQLKKEIFVPGKLVNLVVV